MLALLFAQIYLLTEMFWGGEGFQKNVLFLPPRLDWFTVRTMAVIACWFSRLDGLNKGCIFRSPPPLPCSDDVPSHLVELPMILHFKHTKDRAGTVHEK